MKRIIPLLVILCVLLVACGEEKTVQDTAPTQQDTTPAPEVKQTAPPEPEPEEPKTTATLNIDALKQDGLDCIVKGQKVCLPINYVTAEKGDTVGFAFGMNSLEIDSQKYEIKVEFIETQQEFGKSAIEVDKDYMAKWVKTFEGKTLEYEEKWSQPILIEIKDLIGENKPTESGAYVFEIQAQTYDKGFYHEYGGAQRITVRVQ